MLIVELLHKYPQIMEILKGSKFNLEMDNVYKSLLELQCYNLRELNLTQASSVSIGSTYYKQ